MSIPVSINDRLAAAALKAEGGSQILSLVANAPQGVYVETESGPLPSLAEWQAQHGAALGGVPALTARVNALEEFDDNLSAEQIAHGAGSVSDYLPGFVHVRKFGVVPGGVEDSTAALQAAILAGVPLDFGTEPILVTGTIGGLVIGPINWRSGGCRIINGSPVDIATVIDLEVLPNLEHKIRGHLTVDGASKAFVGIRIWNKSVAGFPLGYANLVADDLCAINLRRASSAYSGGDGIIVRGGFERVVLNRPTIKNVALAAGAGISGSVGVTGITVTGDAAGYPMLVVVNDPQISDIFSEDPSYKDDQDGLRVFGPWGSLLISEYGNSMLVVKGGQFRNCWGRSIKAQTLGGVVDGVTFSKYTGPVGGGAADVDFQVGCGFVKNIHCFYSGHVPSEIVSFQPDPGRESWAGSVSGLKAMVIGATLPAVVSTYPRATTQHQTNISDVDVLGPITRLAEFRVWGNRSGLAVERCTLNNISAELVRVTASGAGGSPYLGNVSVRSVTNLGPVAPLVLDQVAGISAGAIVSDSGNLGFSKQTIFSSTVSPKGGVTRFPSIAGEDASTGTLRVVSLLLASGATVDFPGHGYSLQFAAVVSIGFNNQSQALIAAGAAGAIKLSGGTAIEVAATTEPATGTFRIWFAGGVLKIKNTDASARQATVFYMG